MLAIRWFELVAVSKVLAGVKSVLKWVLPTTRSARVYYGEEGLSSLNGKLKICLETIKAVINENINT